MSASALLGIRNGVYGMQINALLRPTGWRRFAAAHVTIDESTATATGQTRPGGAKARFLGGRVGIFVLWNIMTAVGAFIGDALGDPKQWGLDGAAVAAFLGLLWPRIKAFQPAAIAVVCALVTLLAVPFVPAGVPILVAARDGRPDWLARVQPRIPDTTATAWSRTLTRTRSTRATSSHAGQDGRRRNPKGRSHEPVVLAAGLGGAGLRHQTVGLPGAGESAGQPTDDPHCRDADHWAAGLADGCQRGCQRHATWFWMPGWAPWWRQRLRSGSRHRSWWWSWPALLPPPGYDCWVGPEPYGACWSNFWSYCWPNVAAGHTGWARTGAGHAAGRRAAGRTAAHTSSARASCRPGPGIGPGRRRALRQRPPGQRSSQPCRQHPCRRIWPGR